MPDDRESKIRPVSRTEFDRFDPARGPITELTAQEKEWYVDQAENILGIVFRDRADKDWCYIILGRDERRQFRGITAKINVKTQDEASELLMKKMVEIHDSGVTVFPQGN